MSFDTDLADYTAAQIIAALGCPRSTAYEWKDGRRQPPLWQQSIFLRVIDAHSKRHTQEAGWNAGEAFQEIGHLGRRPSA